MLKNCMTHMYASRAVPKRVFGDDTPELAMFYQVVEEILPGANQLNHDLLSLWQGDALNYGWTLPDGFDVVIKVMGTIEHDIEFLERDYTVVQRINRPQEKGLSLGANVIHSIDGLVVREMARRCNYNPQKVERADYILRMNKNGIAAHRDQDFQLMRLLTLFDMTGFFSLAVIEYLDEENAGHLQDAHRAALAQVLMKLPMKPFPLVCVHDCFKFHANYGNDVRRQYMEILAELAESNTLSSVASDIAGRTITVKKISTRLPELIRESEYSIC